MGGENAFHVEDSGSNGVPIGAVDMGPLVPDGTDPLEPPGGVPAPDDVVFCGIGTPPD